MIKITNKKEKPKSINCGAIPYGSYFLGKIGEGERQLYFCSRLGIVSLENSLEYHFESTKLIEDVEFVDIEVTLKEFTKPV
jgi:hypothetical protein